MIVIDAITRGVASDSNDWQLRRLYLPACLLAPSLLSLALSAYRPSQPSYSTILASSRLLCLCRRSLCILSLYYFALCLFYIDLVLLCCSAKGLVALLLVAALNVNWLPNRFPLC